MCQQRWEYDPLGPPHIYTSTGSEYAHHAWWRSGTTNDPGDTQPSRENLSTLQNQQRPSGRNMRHGVKCKQRTTVIFFGREVVDKGWQYNKFSLALISVPLQHCSSVFCLTLVVPCVAVVSLQSGTGESSLLPTRGV